MNISSYAASKAALDSLTWTWAGEVRKYWNSFDSFEGIISKLLYRENTDNVLPLTAW